MRADREPTNETQFELKYCERCGGLGVRRMGGEQIYCAACTRKVAELPPVSHEADGEGRLHDPQWMRDESDCFDAYEMGIIVADEGVWGE